MPPKQKPGHARFKFVGTENDGKFLIWESVAPMMGDSRHIQYKAPRTWFWRGLTVTKP
jgi:hypothetical protein